MTILSNGHIKPLYIPFAPTLETPEYDLVHGCEVAGWLFWFDPLPKPIEAAEVARPAKPHPGQAQRQGL